MEKIGSIEIRVIGEKGKLQLSPENYDIKEIASILQDIEDLLSPTNKKDRPMISYDLQEGSVRNIFKTSIQAVIGFGALLVQIERVNSIDFLELRTALAIENIQNIVPKFRHLNPEMLEEVEFLVNIGCGAGLIIRGLQKRFLNAIIYPKNVYNAICIFRRSQKMIKTDAAKHMRN